jgi:hypothetical protein
VDAHEDLGELLESYCEMACQSSPVRSMKLAASSLLTAAEDAGFESARV